MTLATHLTTIGKRLIPLAFVLANSEAFANGPFDSTFAGRGMFPYAYLFDEDAANTSAIARDSHDRLLVATSIQDHISGRNKLSVSRHIADEAQNLIIPTFSPGLPDSTFGTNGIATDFFSSGSNSYATAIAIDHRDRILVGGTANGTVSCPDGTTTSIDAFVAVRVRNEGNGFDGLSDLHFGAFGVAIYGDCSHPTSGIAGMAIDQNDNVVAVGTQRQSGISQVALVRWTSAGALDAEFGNAGATASVFDDRDTAGTAIAIDSVGRILVSAQAYSDDTVSAVVMRYKENGELDSSFGKDGFANLGVIGTNPVRYLGHICCIKVDSHGRVVIAGTIAKPSETVPDAYEESAFLARLNASGESDETFGYHGFIYLSDDQITGATALAIDDRDRPIVSGYAKSAFFPNTVSSLLQFNVNGSKNLAVGFQGLYSAAIGFSGTYPSSILIDAAGRPTITATGYDSDTHPVPILIRYDELYGDGFD